MDREPVVLVGDLNVTRHSRAYQLLKSGFTEVFHRQVATFLHFALGLHPPVPADAARSCTGLRRSDRGHRWGFALARVGPLSDRFQTGRRAFRRERFNGFFRCPVSRTSRALTLWLSRSISILHQQH